MIGARARPGAVALALAALLAGCAGDEEAPPRCDLTRCDEACVDVRQDPANCGACGRACAAGEVCSAGDCAITCAAPLEACGEAGSARCVALASDPLHCGACGAACPSGQLCSGGTCVPSCAAGETACSSGEGAWCADVSASALDCGGCGHACLPGTTCRGGACAPTCEGAGGLTCAGACVDPFTDGLHCGACGVPCEAGETCAGGSCTDTCLLEGASRCGDSCVDLATDARHCGGCGRACGAGAACVVGVCAAPLCAAPGLPGPPDFLHTGGPGLALADVDGDGLPDLVTMDEAGARLEVRRALALGGVGPPDAYAVGAGLHIAGSGDVDDDGDVDLVLASYDGGLFFLWENDGAGGYSEGERIVHFDALRALVVDLDGDGRNDLVLQSWFLVRVRLAAGPTQTLYASGIAALHAVDLDGDDRPELLAGSYAGLLPVAVYPNDGAGGFGEPVGGDPAGAYVDDLELADMDRDGDVDVVFLGQQHSSPYEQLVAVSRNEGGGVFGPAEVYPLVPFSAYRYDLLVADLDGDASQDAVVGELDDLRVFVNAGEGALEDAVTYPAGAAQTLAATDLDRDGRVDVLAASRSAAGVAIHRGTGDGAFTGPRLMGDAGSVAEVAIGDFDGDGRSEVATLGPWDRTSLTPAVLKIWRGAPDEPTVVHERAVHGGGGLLAGDLDRDGRSDLVVGAAGGLNVLLGRADGAFEPERPMVGVSGPWLGLADVTGDGFPDAVFEGSVDYARVLQVAVGRGDGTFSLPVVGVGLGGRYADAIAYGDVDGDGRADAVLTERASSEMQVSVFRSRGDATFAEPVTTTFATGFSSPRPPLLAVGDLEGDGAADVVLHVYDFTGVGFDVIRYEGKVFVLRGGPGALGAPEARASLAPPNGLATAALTGAGRRDVVVLGAFGDTVGVLSPRGDGTLADERRWFVPSGAHLAVGDLDGDARDEIVVSGTGGLSVFRGSCLP